MQNSNSVNLLQIWCEHIFLIMIGLLDCFVLLFWLSLHKMAFYQSILIIFWLINVKTVTIYLFIV